jgi:hypothetical protein
MSHFYGTLQGMRGEATRCGSKDSGIDTVAASWKGAIRVSVYHDDETGEDRYDIAQSTWQSSGINQSIATGVIGKPNPWIEAAEALMKHPEVFPAIMGISPHLDALIAKETQ